MEWALRLALECRRRVKEQQKRIGAAEFRNTSFSYALGENGVEKFVVCPELRNDSRIGEDSLEPGQVWGLSPGAGEDNPGLYRIEVNEGPGSGVRLLNKPAPPAFRESLSYAEQNLYARAAQLVGDRDPRQHELAVQLRAFDAAKSGQGLGVAALVALCLALLKRSAAGGLVIVGINIAASLGLVIFVLTQSLLGGLALLVPTVIGIIYGVNYTLAEPDQAHLILLGELAFVAIGALAYGIAQVLPSAGATSPAAIIIMIVGVFWLLPKPEDGRPIDMEFIRSLQIERY